MQRMGAAIAALVIATAATLAWANPQTAEQPAGAAKLGELAWMAGTWRSTDGDHAAEETWSKPEADSMIGSCRLLGGGKVALYEFMLIEQDDDGIRLRLRHFAWNMKEREQEPIVWTLARSGPKLAVFENPQRERVRRVEYSSASADEMTCRLISLKDGKEAVQEFRFKK